MGAANHAGAAGPCGRRSEQTGSMREAGPEPARQNDAAPRETGDGAATGRNRRAERHENQLPDGLKPWPAPGFRGCGQCRQPRKEIPRTFKNPREPCHACGAEPGFPGRASVCAVRLPARSGPAHGHRDRRPFACACQVSAEARITGTPGKMAAPCAGGGGNLFVAVRGPPSIRNSLSVQEARRCAAARHSAFSSTATGHPPGQGPRR